MKPTIKIGSPPVRIYAQRDGDRVTGRVEFPYETYGRTECPINYRSTRPPSSSSSSLHPSSLSGDRAAMRLSAVQRYLDLRKAQPAANKLMLAEDIRAEFGRIFSLSSLRLWARKFETDGPDALRDRYTPRPRKVLSLDADQAKAAVTICAWWAFRIGNCQTIDTPMIHAAASSFILPPSSFILADVLATIDCYYSWQCDRAKMPFKPFGRWARYDFAKWVFRACDENDYRRGLAAATHERVPLMAPQTLRRSDVPDTRTRKRDVLAQGNRRALESLAKEPNRDREGAAQSPIPNPQSPIPNPQSPIIQSPLKHASKLRGMGLSGPARQVVQRAAPGIPALAANDNPQTVAEALGRLDDSYRRMLLDAARGDRGCIAEAVATMPIWWDMMPQEPRHNIDFKVAAWIRDHPGASEKVVTRRKLAMFLPHLRDVRRSGLTALSVCARLPA